MHVTSLIFLAALVCLTASGADGGSKPNILFILMDDLGKEWVSCYGGEGVETPHMDQLAREGIRFENYYTMPQCTPTRVALMTGQYPFRNGWINHWDVPRWGGGCHFDPNLNPSIARVMKEAGYKTAAAGKWQINDFRVQPEAMVEHGFDDYFMWTGYEKGNKPSGSRYWNPYIHTKEGSRTYSGEFGPDLYSDFLIDFMKEHQDEPMFLYYAMCLPHTPFTRTPSEPDAKGTLGRHKAMVRYIDQTLKKLMDVLDELGLRERTLVIFTADNGTERKVTGRRLGHEFEGAKAKTIEAGTAVPFIVSQPGLVPQGKVSKALINVTDMMATFADIAGGELDDRYTYDSFSVKEVLYGRSETGPRKYNLSMGGHSQAKLTDEGVENAYLFRDRVVRDDRYKLYISTGRKPEKLFDLEKDPWETKNQIGNPEVAIQVQELFATIQDHPEQDNDPIYEPLSPQPWDVEVTARSQVWKWGYQKDAAASETKKQ